MVVAWEAVAADEIQKTAAAAAAIVAPAAVAVYKVALAHLVHCAFQMNARGCSTPGLRQGLQESLVLLALRSRNCFQHLIQDDLLARIAAAAAAADIKSAIVGRAAEAVAA